MFKSKSKLICDLLGDHGKLTALEMIGLSDGRLKRKWLGGTLHVMIREGVIRRSPSSDGRVYYERITRVELPDDNPQLNFRRIDPGSVASQRSELGPDAVERLVNFIGHSNDSAEDDDRGRAEDSIVLLLFDDGSGRVMIRKPLGDMGHIEIEHAEQLFSFDSLDDLRIQLQGI